jgi:hypothetical protein
MLEAAVENENRLQERKIEEEKARIVNMQALQKKKEERQRKYNEAQALYQAKLDRCVSVQCSVLSVCFCNCLHIHAATSICTYTTHTRIQSTQHPRQTGGGCSATRDRGRKAHAGAAVPTGMLSLSLSLSLFLYVCVVCTARISCHAKLDTTHITYYTYYTHLAQEMQRLNDQRKELHVERLRRREEHKRGMMIEKLLHDEHRCASGAYSHAVCTASSIFEPILMCACVCVCSA